MFKRAVAMLSALLLLLLSSCSGKTDSENLEGIILDAADVEYNTEIAAIDSIGTEYYVQSEFINPYLQDVYFSEGGIISKIYTGSEIEEGELICELLVDGLEDDIDKQKLITKAAEDTYNNLVKTGVKGTELEYAKINYESEKLKYDKLLGRQENTKIYAPCSGTVKMNEFHAGDWVFPGQHLCSVSDSRQNYLCSFVRGDALADVNFGSKVQIQQGEAIHTEGKVIDIIYQDRGPDYSGYYYVIDTPEDVNFLGFGTINVIFSIEKKDGVVVVPKKSVKEVEGRKYVNVLIDGTKVEMDVETGLSNKNFIEITSGLSGGEEIIVN